MGVVVSFDASESALLGYHDDKAYNGRVLSDRGKILTHCQTLMDAFDVRPAEPRWRTGAFSGGNQQKLVLAREMERRPALLLVGQPTRGVDIGAIEFIHRRLIEMRDAGRRSFWSRRNWRRSWPCRTASPSCSRAGSSARLTPSEASTRQIGLMMAGEAAAA